LGFTETEKMFTSAEKENIPGDHDLPVVKDDDNQPEGHQRRGTPN
jgi:hypothetical protein